MPVVQNYLVRYSRLMLNVLIFSRAAQGGCGVGVPKVLLKYIALERRARFLLDGVINRLNSLYLSIDKVREM